MKIEKQNLEHSLLMWSAFNYKYKRIYVVAYGLQVKQFETIESANVEWGQCLRHSKQCQKHI